MQVLINGNDIDSLYRSKPLNLISQINQYLNRKVSVTTNWQDEDGQEMDTTYPKFDPRNFVIKFIVSGDNIADLLTNYWSLFSLLKIGGTYSLYNDYSNQTIFILYQKQDSLSQPFNDSVNGLSFTFNLTFTETDPFSNIPNIVLVDGTNRYLTP